MLFGALFSAYVLLRTGSFSWPSQHDLMNVPIGTINTMVLITSSITMVMSWISLKRNQFGRYRLYLGLTIILGFLFLVFKTYEYVDHINHHLYPSTNVFMGMYYTMTGDVYKRQRWYSPQSSKPSVVYFQSWDFKRTLLSWR